jgi:hypothetical protein
MDFWTAATKEVPNAYQLGVQSYWKQADLEHQDRQLAAQTKFQQMSIDVARGNTAERAVEVLHQYYKPLEMGLAEAEGLPEVQAMMRKSAQLGSALNSPYATAIGQANFQGLEPERQYVSKDWNGAIQNAMLRRAMAEAKKQQGMFSFPTFEDPLRATLPPPSAATVRTMAPTGENRAPAVGGRSIREMANMMTGLLGRSYESKTLVPNEEAFAKANPAPEWMSGPTEYYSPEQQQRMIPGLIQSGQSVAENPKIYADKEVMQAFSGYDPYMTTLIASNPSLLQDPRIMALAGVIRQAGMPQRIAMSQQMYKGRSGAQAALVGILARKIGDMYANKDLKLKDNPERVKMLMESLGQLLPELEAAYIGGGEVPAEQ